MLLAQLSDLHVRLPGQRVAGVVDTAALARAAVGALCAQAPRPDALLLSGDLVEAGRADEYRHLRDILAPWRGPVWPMAGNHDERVALAEAFADHLSHAAHALNGFVQYQAGLDSLDLLVLDTVVPGAPHGALCERRLAWLAERLRAAQERPVVIAMHHPPFATGIGFMDAMGLREGAAALEALVSRHPGVQAVLCDHLHRSIQTRFGGTLAATCPSTAHQIALDLPGGDAGAAEGFVMEPAGWQLHLWRDGRLVSHTRPVGDFGATRPFEE